MGESWEHDVYGRSAVLESRRVHEIRRLLSILNYLAPYLNVIASIIATIIH